MRGLTCSFVCVWHKIAPRPSCTVMRGSVTVKAQIKKKKGSVQLTWGFFFFPGNRWRCLLRCPWTPIPPCDGICILILIYAAVAKTSLRNHNVSLVAASPTRHPGPLLSGDVQKARERERREEGKKSKPTLRSHTERALAIICPQPLSPSARALPGSPVQAEGPVPGLRVPLRLAWCSPEEDWSRNPHASGGTHVNRVGGVDFFFLIRERASEKVLLRPPDGLLLFPSLLPGTCAARPDSALVLRTRKHLAKLFPANYTRVHCGPARARL